MQLQRWIFPDPARLHRRVVAAFLLVSQLLTATGLPMPVAAAPKVKDTSTPFPCMNRPCGCMSAAQCWKSCCCTTLQQRLAWAQENGVEPPASVKEETDSQDTCNTEQVHQEDAKPCCQKPESGHCPHCKKQLPKSETKQAPKTQPASIRWVIGMMARECQGQGPMNFFAQTPALPPAPGLNLVVQLEVIGVIRIHHEHHISLSEPPLIRPPRSV